MGRSIIVFISLIFLSLQLGERGISPYSKDQYCYEFFKQRLEMKYRRFGKLDWEVSILCFGVMRLPLIDENPTHLNEVESIKMIRYAIDHGINYLYLVYPFDNRQNEFNSRLVSQALRDGYREKVKIAATIPFFLINSPSDFEHYLSKQLQWLQTDTIDFYLLGKLNRENWPKLHELGVLRWAEVAMIDGRIDKLGFSFHDHFQTLKNIVEAYDNWTFCQFQYSYMDVDHDPGFSGIKYCAEKGLAVVVTEPLKFGRLAKEHPGSVVPDMGRLKQ